MSVNPIFERSFTKYKKVKPLLSIFTSDSKDKTIYDIIEKDLVTEDDIKEYDVSPGDSENFTIENGFLYPDVPKFNQILDEGKEADERITYFVSGPAGSGKSRFAATIAKRYKKNNPLNNIYLISPVLSPVIMALNPEVINCISADKIYTNFIDKEERLTYMNDDGTCDFDNSLVIIDDIKSLKVPSNKDKKKVLESFYDSFIDPLLEAGRHRKTSLIMAVHVANANKQSRDICSECEYVAVFPQKADTQKLNYFLNAYIGLSKGYIKRIMKERPKYFIHHARYPFVDIMPREISYDRL